MSTDRQHRAADIAAFGYPSGTPSIDDLDAAIRGVAREINTHRYRMLMLVREFDDRMGWQKCSMRNCAEWLAWRCDLSLSAAREHVRTAHALREMPAVAAAFEDGRLSYSKVRALTRVVEHRDEDTLLTYAIKVSASRSKNAAARSATLRQSIPSAARGALGSIARWPCLATRRAAC